MAEIQRRTVVKQWTYATMGPFQLTTSGTARVPVGLSGAAQKIVDSIILTNTTGGAVTYTIRLIPSGVTQSGTLQDLYTAVSLAANTSTIINFSALGGEGGLVLSGGDTLSILASAGASINCTVNYRVEG